MVLGGGDFILSPAITFHQIYECRQAVRGGVITRGGDSMHAAVGYRIPAI